MITRGNSWASEAARSPYPFVDVASLQDTSGLLKLAPSWILDAKFWPIVSAASKLYLSSVERTTSSLVLTVSSLDESIGTAVITDFTKRRVAFRTATSGVVGFMSFAAGGLQHIHDVPSRLYQFSVAATEFAACAIASRVSSGLRAIADSRGSVLTSRLSLVGGEGVNLTVCGQQLRVDILGDPYFSRDTCEDADALGRALRPVRMVHYRDFGPSAAQGVLRPYAGNIATVMVSDSPDFRARGFRSPGSNGALIEKIGA